MRNQRLAAILNAVVVLVIELANRNESQSRASYFEIVGVAVGVAKAEGTRGAATRTVVIVRHGRDPHLVFTVQDAGGAPEGTPTIFPPLTTNCRQVTSSVESKTAPLGSVTWK